MTTLYLTALTIDENYSDKIVKEINKIIGDKHSLFKIYKSFTAENSAQDFDVFNTKDDFIFEMVNRLSLDRKKSTDPKNFAKISGNYFYRKVNPILDWPNLVEQGEFKKAEDLLKEAMESDYDVEKDIRLNLFRETNISLLVDVDNIERYIELEKLIVRFVTGTEIKISDNRLCALVKRGNHFELLDSMGRTPIEKKTTDHCEYIGYMFRDELPEFTNEPKIVHLLTSRDKTNDIEPALISKFGESKYNFLQHQRIRKGGKVKLDINDISNLEVVFDFDKNITFRDELRVDRFYHLCSQNIHSNTKLHPKIYIKLLTMDFKVYVESEVCDGTGPYQLDFQFIRKLISTNYWKTQKFRKNLIYCKRINVSEASFCFGYRKRYGYGTIRFGYDCQ